MNICKRIRDYAWFVRSVAIRRRYRTVAQAPVTVVLVPGIFEGQSQLETLAQALNGLGYRIVHVPELKLQTAPTSDLAQMLLRRVAEINGPVILLAHSKGGLIGREVLTHRNELNQLVGMVAIATPWQGSSLARFFPHTSAVRRLAPQGGDIGVTPQPLDTDERIYSLIPAWDPHVPNGSYLPGAHNIRLSSAGHFLPLGTLETQRYVAECIKRLLRAR
ncbi:hypothetical protein [Arcanobacterium phocae]|uniref:hypothetical protein n=1 Tax=Arcanobacterium phocae TaxID=131112 RepID=UPI001C0ECC29|nr:hypothetical protein [Arcanobacterium phocae]